MRHTDPFALPVAEPVENLSRPQHGAGRLQMSHTKVLDPRAFRARFADYWSQFLRANYRNPEEVAVCYGVRYQTAVNWWNGANRPSGDVVALAGSRFHDFMESRT